MVIQIDDILNRHRVFHRIARRFLFENVATGFHFGTAYSTLPLLSLALIQSGFAVFLIELGKLQFLFLLADTLAHLEAYLRVATFRNCSILSFITS
jgi:hypothetical protein